MSSPDLGDIDDLCRLAVAARRLSCRICLAGSHPDLAALLELAGLGDVATRCPTAGIPGERHHRLGTLR